MAVLRLSWYTSPCGLEEERREGVFVVGGRLEQKCTRHRMKDKGGHGRHPMIAKVKSGRSEESCWVRDLHGHLESIKPQEMAVLFPGESDP